MQTRAWQKISGSSPSTLTHLSLKTGIVLDHEMSLGGHTSVDFKESSATMVCPDAEQGLPFAGSACHPLAAGT